MQIEFACDATEGPSILGVKPVDLRLVGAGPSRLRLLVGTEVQMASVRFVA